MSLAWSSPGYICHKLSLVYSNIIFWYGNKIKKKKKSENTRQSNIETETEKKKKTCHIVYKSMLVI